HTLRFLPRFCRALATSQSHPTPFRKAFLHGLSIVASGNCSLRLFGVEGLAQQSVVHNQLLQPIRLRQIVYFCVYDEIFLGECAPFTCAILLWYPPWYSIV